MKNFALIGAAGYIAPRHIQAIKDTGNHLVAATDPHDSVGILDRYFYNVSYFREFERFDRHIEKLKFSKNEDAIDYVSVCSPNYLHDAHIRFGLRADCSVICEKPIVINPWNIDHLSELEANSKGNVYTVLQLRLHPSIIALRERVQAELKSNPNKIYDIDLTYLTSRGAWYHFSWKGDEDKSGGLANNIGIHFFDMLNWIFGESTACHVFRRQDSIVSGYMELKNAKVRWLLSVDRDLIPEKYIEKGQFTYRSITVDGEEIEFSSGFTDLHTKVYEDVLNGGGYGLKDARESIEVVHQIRNAELSSQDKERDLTFNYLD